jgi:hypothetical protein
MNLFALSFDRREDKATIHHYLYKFVPITPEQARGQITTREIPAGALGSLVPLHMHNTNMPLYYVITGSNQFRLATPEELKKYLEASANV